MKCRHCLADVKLRLIDLGSAPPSNAYLTPDQLQAPEKTYPLTVMVCEQCWLVQTQDFAQAEDLFSGDYAYFSSFSTSWLDHAQRYVAEMVDRWQLGASSRLVNRLRSNPSGTETRTPHGSPVRQPASLK